MAEKVKITFLVDNSPGGNGCGGEHGLSMFIEAGQNILFDSGQSRLFLENAALLGINVDSARIAILSHGHYDHGNGFFHLTKRPLLCHPGCFIKRYREKGSVYIGLNYDHLHAESAFELILKSEPYKVSDNVVFLGQIPRVNAFEARTTTFKNENDQPDFVIDDSGLAITTSEGLLVISGCAHSGICNIVEHARRVTGVEKVVAVIGGFHIKEDSQIINETFAYFEQLNPGLLMPCHCVDASVIGLFHTRFRCEEVFSGRTIEFAA